MSKIEISMLTTKTYLEADSEARLHDLTHRLVGQVGSYRCQQQCPQHLEQGTKNRRKPVHFNARLDLKIKICSSGASLGMMSCMTCMMIHVLDWV